MAAKAKATDVTGRAREALTKLAAEDAIRRNDITMATQAEESLRLETEVVDMTNPARPTTVIDEVEDLGVGLEDDTVVVRVAEDLENMTLGVGNHFSFKAGQKYKVSRAVADHLQEKGYLYDRL